MNQKEAVFTAVCAVVEMNGSRVAPSQVELKAIEAEVFRLFKSGEVDYRGGLPDDAKLMKYIPGLVNNWLRKDLRLNGGAPYVTKNPGSRSGSGDETLRAMKALLAATTDSTARTEIQQAIDARIEELKPKVEINVTKLPEHLVRFVPPTIRKA
jgi:hypothetical protein